jgi:hypothetical protein
MLNTENKILNILTTRRIKKTSKAESQNVTYTTNVGQCQNITCSVSKAVLIQSVSKCSYFLILQIHL